MKDAIVNTHTRRIRLVLKENDIKIAPDGCEIVKISNAKADIFNASDEPLFLIDGEIRTILEKNAKRREANLDRFKPNKIAEIKLARDDEYKSVLVTSDGLHFKADLETIIDITTIIDMLPDGGSYENYKNADGSYNTITKAQFQTAISEGIARKSDAFAKEKGLVDDVMNATTIEELEQIHW